MARENLQNLVQYKKPCVSRVHQKKNILKDESWPEKELIVEVYEKLLLNLIPSGKTHSDGVWLLGISRSSLVRWLKRPLLAPSLRGGKKSRDLGVDLQDFLAAHLSKTLDQWSLLLPLKK